MMVRQLSSLLMLLLALSAGVAFTFISPVDLASRLVEVAGDTEALRIAGAGTLAAYFFVKQHDALLLLPWLLAGMATAVVARIGIWQWTKPAAPVDLVRLRDEAGGTVEMYGTAMSHDPGIRFIASMPVQGALDGATAFESELFNVILAAGDIPMDVTNASTQRLADYVRSAWGHIVEKHGAGSLAAMLVISHQVGKVLAFKKTKTGWTLASDKFAQQSSVVVRRTRAFYSLPRATRDDLLQCLSVLSSNWVPIGLRDDLHAAVRDVRIADLVPVTAKGPTAAATSDDAVDIRKIATLVSSQLILQFADFNINQSRSKSEALDGLFLKKELALLVPPRQMREALSRLLPKEVSNRLRLDMPTTGKHPSDPVLVQVLEATGELVTVLRQVNAVQGNFAVRSGQRKFPSMWALSTKNVKQDIVDAWGEWPYDIEILAQGDLNGG